MNIACFKDMDSLYVEISPENPAQALSILKIGDLPGQVEIIDKKTSGSIH